MGYLLFFDEHDYNHASGDHKKDLRHPSRIRYLSSPQFDYEEKKILQLDLKQMHLAARSRA